MKVKSLKYRSNGFSLLEVLVVVTLIALIASIVGPNLRRIGKKNDSVKEEHTLKMLQGAYIDWYGQASVADVSSYNAASNAAKIDILNGGGRWDGAPSGASLIVVNDSRIRYIPPTTATISGEYQVIYDPAVGEDVVVSASDVTKPTEMPNW